MRRHLLNGYFFTHGSSDGDRQYAFPMVILPADYLLHMDFRQF